MASFTDTVPQFNPYIQQLPVEAMVKVGQLKQGQYDQGIQKIQANIDAVGGLDIGRDVDKAYLQSKINELGNGLKVFMASDFSDSQLVNSVNGMTGKLVKDPYVRSAVASTANDRKQTASMDADREKGTLTPQAEYYYNLKRQKYYNDPNLKSENGDPINFTGKYTQSWDIDKNIIEAIKGVGDSEWSADNIFMIVNGQIAKDANGQPILSDYATREKRKGKFPENVAAAIDGVLNRPEAKQELSMRGIYNYRGYDNIDSFVAQYEKMKVKSITNLEGTKLEFMEKVANATTKEDKLKYQTEINRIDSKIESINKDTDLKESEALQFGSVEAYKAALETMKVRDNYMLSGVTAKTSVEVIENVAWKARRQVVEEERKWWATKDNSNRGWANTGIARDAQTLKEKQWEYDPKNPNNKIPPTDPALPIANKFESIYGNFADAVTEAEVTLEATKFNIVSEYMSAINFGNGKELSVEEIQNNIKNYEKNSPGFIERMYERAKNVATDKTLATKPLYAQLMSSLPAASAAESNVARLDNKIINMNKSPNVIASGGKEVDIEGIAKEFKPFELEYVPLSNWSGTSFSGGEKVKKRVNAQDALDIGVISANEGGIKGMWKSLFSSDQEKDVYNKAKQRLESKFDLPSDELLDVVRNRRIGGTLPGIPVNFNMNPSLGKVVDIVKSEKFNNVLKAKEEYLRNNSWTPQPVAYSLYGENMKGPERTSVDDRVKVVLNDLKGTGGLEAFNNIYTDSKNFNAQISVDRGSTFIPKEDFSLNLYDAEGLVKSIPISKTQANYMKGFDIKLPERVSYIAESLVANGGKTTNNLGLSPNDPRAYTGAVIPGTYFSEKFNTTDVLGADIVPNNSGGFNAYLYTKDLNGDKIGVPLKANKGDLRPNSFNTADSAAKYILENITNKAYLNNLINNGL